MLHTKQGIVMCFIMIIIIFLSGMRFENMEADSLFVCAPMEKQELWICSYDAMTDNEDICTAKMLRIGSNVYAKQTANRHMCQKKDYRLSFEFLWVDIYSPSLNKVYTNFENDSFIESYHGEIVLNYIHNSDGKKRV